MSWTCVACATVNDDGQGACSVCGTASAARPGPPASGGGDLPPMSATPLGPAASGGRAQRPAPVVPPATVGRDDTAVGAMPMAPAPDPGDGNSRTVAIAVATSVVVLVVAVVAAFLVTQGGGEEAGTEAPTSIVDEVTTTTTTAPPTTTTMATTTTAPPPPPTTSPPITVPPTTPPPAPDVAGPSNAMEAEAQSDAAAASSVLDRWIVQVASTDSTDEGAIMREHQQFEDRYPGDAVILVNSSDYYSFRRGGYWVTLVARTFPSAADANAFCDSEGYEPTRCLAKQLSHSTGYDAATVERG